MPVGLGGAIAEGLGGDLNQQLANKLAGPSPNPNPGATPPAAGGGAPPTPAPGANLPPAQAYAPDPANASTIALLLKVHQQDALGADLNQRIAGISAGFGTAQQQQSKMSQLQALGGIPDDRLKAIQESQGIMQEQQKQTEHSQFMAGADIMGQQLLGLKPGQGAWLADSGQLPEIVQSHLHSMEPTDAVKNWSATRKAMLDAGTDPQTVDKLMPPEMMVLGPNADISQRQYTIEQIQARAAGKTDFPDYDTWKAQHATTAKVSTDKAMDRENAGQALPDVNRQLGDTENKIDEVLNDPNLPSLIGKWTPSSGMASLVTATEGQRQLATKISVLMSENYAQGFKIGGASRKTQYELGQLSAALNGTLGATATLNEKDYRNGVLDLKNRIRTTHANAYGEAGDYSNMPSWANGYLDPAYRQGGNLTANGAPGALKTPSDDDKKDFATIANQYGRQAAILHFRESGVDPTGL